MPLLVGVGNQATAATALVPKACRSWQHRDCAEPKAQKTLERLARNLLSLEAVYVAVVDYDPQLLNRVSQRRVQHGGEGLSVRRVDQVHLYSTRALPGTKPPTVWIEIDPESALVLAAAQSLRLPGLSNKPLGWSDGWQVHPTDDEEDRARLWKRAGAGPREDVMEAIRRAGRKAKIHFGVAGWVSRHRDCGTGRQWEWTPTGGSRPWQSSWPASGTSSSRQMQDYYGWDEWAGPHPIRIWVLLRFG